MIRAPGIGNDDGDGHGDGDGSGDETPVGPDDPPTRILIVDDEPIYLEYLDRFLSREGFDVRTAETADEAIRIARGFLPNLLLADWMLRCDLHGIEVAERIRDSQSDLRILVMTGFPTVELEARARRANVDGVLAKPFALDDLTRAIHGALERPDS